MPPASRAITLADAVSILLLTLGALVRSQRRVDLAGLEQEVGRLCAACVDLPPDQGRQILPRLHAILAELTTLGAALAAAHPRTASGGET